METIVRKDVDVLANLIKSFEEETDMAKKLLLADILSNLRCENVKDFLVEVLDVVEDYTDKIWAAGNLLKFEDERAVEVLKELVKKVDEGDLYWLLEVIGKANNPTSMRLALYLADTYEKLNKMIDRSYFEKALKEYK